MCLSKKASKRARQLEKKKNMQVVRKLAKNKKDNQVKEKA